MGVVFSFFVVVQLLNYAHEELEVAKWPRRSIVFVKSVDWPKQPWSVDAFEAL